MTLKRTLCTLAVILAVASSAYAQETRGGIEGTVKDASGGVLPGATVEAKSPSLVGTAIAVADARGVYRFPALAPGKYEVSASLQGFSQAKVENIELQIGQILKIDLTLGVATLTEVMSVTAESPLIDVKQNAASSTISAAIIDRIPKGRDFTEVLRLAAGTQIENKSGIQIDGAGGSEHRYVIDGMDTTGIRTGVSGQEMPTDFIQEVQVKASGYNAEFRATTGGVISAITKSGSNVFRGGAGSYYRDNNFNGAPRPSLRLKPTDQTKAEYIITPDDEFYRAEPTFELGGPIRRNRLWFFVGYAPDIEHQSRTVTFSSNNQTATFKQDEEDHNIIAKITAQLSRNKRLTVGINRQWFRDEPGFPGIEPDRTSTSNPALFPGTIVNDTFDNYYTGSFDWVLTNKLYANVSGGLYDYGTHGFGASNKLRHVFSASNFQFPEIPDNLKNVNNYADFPSSSVTVFDDFRRYTATGDVTYYASKWGDHMLKSGAQYERIWNDRLGGAQYPTISLLWDSQRATLDGRRVRGTYGHYTITRTYQSGEIHTNGFGVFLQDAWAVRRNLTLNLGVRADKEEIPSYSPGNPGIKFGFGDKISPRAGFSWDIFSDGRWKAYGSWGIFYDTSKLEMPRGLFGSEHSVTYYYTLDTYDWPSIQCDHPPVPGPNCPGTYIEQVDFRHAANSLDNFLLDPNLKPIRTHEYTLGLDQELNRTMSFGVRYSRKRFDRTIEDTGVLVPGVGEVYRITNPSERIGENVLRDFAGCTSCPNQPKPTRNYDGVELRLTKRLSNAWSLTTMYTYSRLWGNYSGLTSSDENNRNSPSVNRFFDGQYYSFNHLGVPVFGLLQSDRPHVLKTQGTYDFRWGTGLGVIWEVKTGTPLQTQMSEKGIPFFPFGRGNLGRTPTLHQTDIYLHHSLPLRGHQRVTFGVNVLNLFDQDIITRRAATPYRDGFNVADAVFFSGTFDPVTLATAAPATYRPNATFGLADQFQARRQLRVNVHWTF